jgi:uncharacterized protein (TIGR00730 family)
MVRNNMARRESDKPEELLNVLQNTLKTDKTDLRSMLYKDILTNALKCKSSELDILDLKVVDRAVAEFIHAACVFKPYRNVRKVSIFGSARVTEESPYYKLAVKFGRLMAESGFMVITGAAEGIMRAGIEGAGPENSFGVNILLPVETGPTRIIRDDPKVVRFKYFFTRKIFFVMEADAIALFPGGFGTHDEGFEVLTLLQTGKAPPMPIVLMELPGERYWESWDQFIRRQLLTRNLISPEDLSFYKIMHSPEEAVDWIRTFYSTYHSIRQVRNLLVIRLEKELQENHIKQLNVSFKDMIKSGEIAKTAPLSVELDEPNLLSKPRIAFAYNKKSAGRLNEMILTINGMSKIN